MKTTLVSLFLFISAWAFCQENSCIPCKNKDLLAYRNMQQELIATQNKWLLSGKVISYNPQQTPFLLSPKIQEKKETTFLESMVLEMGSEIFNTVVTGTIESLLWGESLTPAERTQNESVRSIPAVYP